MIVALCSTPGGSRPGRSLWSAPHPLRGSDQHTRPRAGAETIVSWPQERRRCGCRVGINRPNSGGRVVPHQPSGYPRPTCARGLPHAGNAHTQDPRFAQSLLNVYWAHRDLGSGFGGRPCLPARAEQRRMQKLLCSGGSRRQGPQVRVPGERHFAVLRLRESQASRTEGASCRPRRGCYANSAASTIGLATQYWIGFGPG